MLAFILALVPQLVGPIASFFTAMKDAQVKMFMARTGSAQDVAVEALRGQTAVQTKWWFAALPPAIIGFTIASYVFKTIAWDVVIGSLFGCYGVTPAGTCTMFITDPLRGDLHWVFIAVITGYFGTSMVDKFLNTRS
jgi:hypothetical protein